MVEDVFKNVQVMKAIPVGEFMDTMGFVSAALGLNCTGCHVPESLQDWSKFADDIPRKRTARAMIRMVDTINKTNFGGRRVLTCWSCHRGTQIPEVIPSLAAQYTIATKIRTRLRSCRTGRKSRPQRNCWAIRRIAALLARLTHRIAADEHPGGVELAELLLAREVSAELQVEGLPRAVTAEVRIARA